MGSSDHVGEPSDDRTEALAGGGVDAVDRAFAIMQAFDVSNGRLSLGALAKHTGFYQKHHPPADSLVGAGRISVSGSRR